MKLQRYNVSDDYYRNGFSEDDRGDWCMSVHVDVLEAENESLKEHLADTRRMLLWLRNHYDLFDCKKPDAEELRRRVIERVDKLIPNDGSEPDYSDIPHKDMQI